MSVRLKKSKSKGVKAPGPMDKVKIKRVKRNKKKATTGEKVLAGLGVGGTLLGGVGSVQGKASQTQFVRQQGSESSAGKSQVRETLQKIFGATLGVESAKAATTDTASAAPQYTDAQIQAQKDAQYILSTGYLPGGVTKATNDQLSAANQIYYGQVYNNAKSVVTAQQQGAETNAAATSFAGSAPLTNSSGRQIGSVNHIGSVVYVTLDDGTNLQFNSQQQLNDYLNAPGAPAGLSQVNQNYSQIVQGTYNAPAAPAAGPADTQTPGQQYTDAQLIANINNWQYAPGSVPDAQFQRISSQITVPPVVQPGSYLAFMLGLGNGSGLTAGQAAPKGTDGKTYVFDGKNFVEQSAYTNYSVVPAGTNLAALLGLSGGIANGTTVTASDDKTKYTYNNGYFYLNGTAYFMQASSGGLAGSPVLTLQNINSTTYDGSKSTNAQIDTITSLVTPTILAGYQQQGIKPGSVLAYMLGLGNGTSAGGLTLSAGNTIVGTDGKNYIYDGTNFYLQGAAPSVVLTASNLNDVTYNPSLNGQIKILDLSNYTVPGTVKPGSVLAYMLGLGDGSTSLASDKVNSQGQTVRTGTDGKQYVFNGTNFMLQPPTVLSGTGNNSIVINGLQVSHGGDNSLTGMVTLNGQPALISINRGTGAILDSSGNDITQQLIGQGIDVSALRQKFTDALAAQEPANFGLNSPIAARIGLSTNLVNGQPVIAIGNIPVDVIVVGGSLYEWQNGQFVKIAEGQQAAALISADTSGAKWYSISSSGTPSVGGVFIKAGQDLVINTAEGIGLSAVVAGAVAASAGTGIAGFTAGLTAGIAASLSPVTLGISAGVGLVIDGITSLLNSGQDKVRDTKRIEAAYPYFEQIIQKYYSVTPTTSEEAQALHDAAVNAIQKIFDSIPFEKSSSRTSQQAWLQTNFYNGLDQSLQKQDAQFTQQLKTMQVSQTPSGIRSTATDLWGVIRVDANGNLLSMEKNPGYLPPPSILNGIKNATNVSQAADNSSLPSQVVQAYSDSDLLAHINDFTYLPANIPSAQLQRIQTQITTIPATVKPGSVLAFMLGLGDGSTPLGGDKVNSQGQTVRTGTDGKQYVFNGTNFMLQSGAVDIGGAGASSAADTTPYNVYTVTSPLTNTPALASYVGTDAAGNQIDQTVYVVQVDGINGGKVLIAVDANGVPIKDTSGKTAIFSQATLNAIVAKAPGGVFPVQSSPTASGSDTAGNTASGSSTATTGMTSTESNTAGSGNTAAQNYNFTYYSGAGVTSPNGQFTPFNPGQFATYDTAQKVAQLLGGQVSVAPAVGVSTPSYVITFAGSSTAINAGLAAQSIQQNGLAGAKQAIMNEVNRGSGLQLPPIIRQATGNFTQDMALPAGDLAASQYQGVAVKTDAGTTTAPDGTSAVTATAAAGVLSFTVNGTAPNVVRVGDSWHILIIGAAKDAAVTVTGGRNGTVATAAMGTTNPDTGAFELSGTFGPDVTGTWSENWQVNGVSVGQLNFTVQAAGQSSGLTLNNFSVNHAPVGSVVIVSGANFPALNNIAIRFINPTTKVPVFAVTPTSASAKTLQFVVPRDLASGQYLIAVANFTTGEVSGMLPFTVDGLSIASAALEPAHLAASAATNTQAGATGGIVMTAAAAEISPLADLSPAGILPIRVGSNETAQQNPTNPGKTPAISGLINTPVGSESFSLDFRGSLPPVVRELSLGSGKSQLANAESVSLLANIKTGLAEGNATGPTGGIEVSAAAAEISPLVTLASPASTAATASSAANPFASGTVAAPTPAGDSTVFFQNNEVSSFNLKNLQQSSNADFIPGENWQQTIVGTPGTQLLLYGQYTPPGGASQNIPAKAVTIPASGTLVLSGTFTDSQIGNWANTWYAVSSQGVLERVATENVNILPNRNSANTPGTAAVASNPQVNITMQQSVPNEIRAGDSWQVSISGAPKDSPVYLASSKNGSAPTSVSMGATDANGNFNLTGVFGGDAVGLWSETWTVGNTPVGGFGFLVRAASAAPAAALDITFYTPNHSQAGKNLAIIATNLPQSGLVVKFLDPATNTVMAAVTPTNVAPMAVQLAVPDGLLPGHYLVQLVDQNSGSASTDFPFTVDGASSASSSAGTSSTGNTTSANDAEVENPDIADTGTAGPNNAGVGNADVSVTDTANADATAMQNQILALQGQITELQQQLSQANADMANTASTAGQNQTLSDQVQTLQEQIASLREQLNSSNSSASSANDAIAALNDQISSLNDQINNLQSNLNQSETANIAASDPSQLLQMPPGYTALGALDMNAAPSSQANVQSVDLPQAPSQTSALPQSASPARTYTVKKGDTLWAIAKHFYGDGSKWRKILAANTKTVRSPRTLRIGTVLIIPDLPASAMSSSASQT